MKNIYKYVVAYFILIVGAPAGLISCADDVGSRTVEIGEDETLVIFTPGKVGLHTRAGTETSDAIETLEIIAFENMGEDRGFQYTYRVTAQEAQETGKYNVMLRSTDSEVILLLVANFDDFSRLQLGCPFGDVTELFTREFSDSWLENIPMVGEVRLQELPAGEAIDQGNIPLIRATAGVHVRLADAGTNWDETFILKSVQVYRVNDSIQLIPDGGLPADMKVTAASIPSGTQNKIMTPVIETMNGETAITGIYIPESEAKNASEEIKRTEATCLIVGGIYLGDDIANEKVTYYRVDFNKDINDDSDFGQILRNHLYDIVIKNVTGPGTTHPEEVLESVQVNLTTDITQWVMDESLEINYGEGSNPLYFGISDQRVYLSWFEGATKTVLVKTNVEKYVLQYCDDSGTVLQEIEKGGVITTSKFRIEHQWDSIVYTALQENRTGNLLQDSIRIVVTDQAGGIDENRKIYIFQYASNRYEKNYVSIYSFLGTLANLGDDVLQPEKGEDYSVSQTLRSFFKNEAHFGPNGVIPFGGFTTGAMEYEKSLTYKLADIFEVIVIPYHHDIVIDPDVVERWLEDQPNRVLLLFNQMEHIVSHFGRAAYNIQGIPDTYRAYKEMPRNIMIGPFGNTYDRVQQGLTLPIVELSSVYGLKRSDARNQGVSPIVVYGPDEDIIIGIDFDKRIIYMGDVNLFDADSDKYGFQFFSPDGSIRQIDGEDAPSDVIFCNIIAWIAETVIGDQLAADK